MKILVECYTDTLFIGLLGYECVADHSSIGNVARRMKTKFHEDVVLGIIDDDRVKPLYFDDFKEIRSNHAVAFLKHKTNKRRYLVFIKPDIEGFIATSAKEVKMKEIITIPKTSKISQDRNVKNYLNTIINKKPGTITYLKECVEEVALVK